MIEYKYFNANPRGNDTNDCVIRAISIFRYFMYAPFKKIIIDKKDIDYEYNFTYKELYMNGIQNSLMINDERNYKMFLKDYLKLSERCFDKNSIRVRDLKIVFQNQNMIVNLNGHLTVIIDNVLYDTVDCRDEFVESIFIDEF